MWFGCGFGHFPGAIDRDKKQTHHKKTRSKTKTTAKPQKTTVKPRRLRETTVACGFSTLTQCCQVLCVVSLYGWLWLWLWLWLCVVVCGSWCGRGCGTLNPPPPPSTPCVRPKRLCVYIRTVPVCMVQQVHMFYTYGRGAGTHADVLNVYTEAFWMDTREGVIASSACQKWPRRVITWNQRFTKSNHWMLPIFSLRIGQEQHVFDSSNHSHYLMQLLSSSYPEGKCGGNQL